MGTYRSPVSGLQQIQVEPESVGLPLESAADGYGHGV